MLLALCRADVSVAHAFIVGALREKSVSYPGTSVLATVARPYITGLFQHGVIHRGMDTAAEWIRAPSLELQTWKEHVVRNDKPKRALGGSNCKRCLVWAPPWMRADRASSIRRAE